ncbi:putative Transcription factor AP-1 [Hypsibius exemplaris]|uniref:Transcription factor AP-1 n=1 Tax=Hypsibius exemplaris TaxID=2072580 RepID=A0A1W0XF68_HYPEX|nr:putative Transcription factor AP-1 [Hypsibius exemplaris]
MDVSQGHPASSQSTTITTTSAATDRTPSSSPAKKQRGNLTLDLHGPAATAHTSGSLVIPTSSGGGVEFRPSPGFMLTSPDVQMLQLASPELEKFIIQGLMGQNTPTPTQLVFPKNVTEEQESYAKGFVDALNALHRSGMAYNVVTPGQGQGFPINNANGQNIFPQFFTMPTQQQFVQPQLMQQQPLLQIQSQQQQQPQQQQQHSLNLGGGGQIQPKMEPYSPSPSPAPSDPQTVPSDRGSSKSTNSSSAGTSPINMETQGKMKQERKRERNRLAAAKCRMRKLERISQLEERVKELKEQNAGLTETSSHLRNDLASLRQELLNHMQQGCNLSLPQHILQSLQQQQQMQE